jgi:hypothetical protein
MPHTPTPWRVRELIDRPDLFHVSAPTPEGHPYHGHTKEIEIMSDEHYPTKRADAEFIVRAVNSHEALVEACNEAKKALEYLHVNDSDYSFPSTLSTINAAIKLAEGRE